MHRTGLYPLSLLGAVSQFLQRLEKAGVNPQDFVQCGIDSPAFREQLVKAYKQANPIVLFGIPDKPQNLERFLMQVFGFHVRTEEEIRSQHERYMSDWPERLQELLHGNEQNIAELDRLLAIYQEHENFVGLFDGLDERSISVVVVSLGLDDGKGKTLKSTGEAHGISAQLASGILNRAFTHIRRNHDEAARQERLSPDNVLSARIEDLDLSERARNPLRRTQINTIGDLVSKSEYDLLLITNFGDKSLGEVKAKLAELGLSLRQ